MLEGREDSLFYQNLCVGGSFCLSHYVHLGPVSTLQSHLFQLI